MKALQLRQLRISNLSDHQIIQVMHTPQIQVPLNLKLYWRLRMCCVPLSCWESTPTLIYPFSLFLSLMTWWLICMYFTSSEGSKDTCKLHSSDVVLLPVFAPGISPSEIRPFLFCTDLDIDIFYSDPAHLTFHWLLHNFLLFLILYITPVNKISYSHNP